MIPGWLKNLDRRWIFLLMFLAVSLPQLFGVSFPERPSRKVLDVFDAIDGLAEGSRVLMAFDFDPASEGELSPMASAFTRHCCEKKLKLYFMTLWERGPPMVQKALDIIASEHPSMTYGTDFVNLGFKPGLEGVIRNAFSNLHVDFKTDQAGNSLHDIALTRELKSLREMDLLICIGSGSPGPKEWVQYGAAPNAMRMVAGVTGVQAPQLLPYVPRQLVGLLAAIKSAAEYEQALIDRYPQLARVDQAKEGLRRMGPQLVAHVLMVLLIVSGNLVYFLGGQSGDAP